MDWQSIASSAQASVLNAIPEKWRLPSKDPFVADVRSIPRDCGLLTPDQLSITEHTATEILEKLHDRTWSSVEVVEAFCGRAAIAHLLVRIEMPVSKSTLKNG
jgi:amidase